MVKSALLAFGFCLILCASASAEEIDLASWARSLPAYVQVKGSKMEPTYAAAIDISRNGDVFSILGGAPAWMERSRETIMVDASGAMRHVECPKGMDCQDAPRPAGFLSMAALISAERKGALMGQVGVETYGRFRVICVPAEKLGVAVPIRDPCFELNSGAAIAQKSRFSHRFDGPTLEPSALQISHTFDPVNTKEKAK